MKNRFFFALAAGLLAACASGPVNIPPDSKSQEVIQMAQSAMDRNSYNQAVQYYEALIERFPYDNDAVCCGVYGIAFIHYKQKKYSVSKDEFHALLARYDAPGGSVLPKKYQILSLRFLESIAEKQKVVAEE